MSLSPCFCCCGASTAVQHSCCCGEAGEEALIQTMPLISEAPQQLGKRGPELQLRNTIGWRPSIMLRTSDVNSGGVPPARVSTQIPRYHVPPARAAHPGGQIRY